MRVSAALLLAALLPALAGGRAGLEPTFAARQQLSVVARVGEAATLRCRVLRLAEREVLWVRSSDLQILTHAGEVFTADSRVSCSEESWDAEVALDSDSIISADDDWDTSGTVHSLRIDKLRVSDSGRYECQINTEPKLSMFFNLTVVEDSMPSVSIRPMSPHVSGRLGGSASLACEARYQTRPGSAELPPSTLAALPPLRIYWIHDGETLDSQSGRGGVSLEGERWAGRAVSRLTLARLRRPDAGRYHCTAAAARATLTLTLAGAGDDDTYLDEAEGSQEAMQRDAAAARIGAAAAAARGRATLAPTLAAAAAALLRPRT